MTPASGVSGMTTALNNPQTAGQVSNMIQGGGVQGAGKAVSNNVIHDDEHSN